MKVAIAQLNYTVGDLVGNKTKIINAIGSAKEKGAELVVFAEFAVSGTQAFDLFGKSPFMEDCEEALSEIAGYCDGIAAIVGTPLLMEQGIVSAAAFIENKKIVKYIGKRTIQKQAELVYIKPSAGGEIIKINGKKVIVKVGEDLLTEREYGDIDTIISIYADRFSRGQIALRYDFFRNLAPNANKTFIYVNHLGGQANIIFDGSSFVMRKEKGIAFLKSFEEELCVVDTETAEAVDDPLESKTAEVFEAIKLGLADYFEKGGFGKACLGLSGGIDSAVALAMAVEALGADRVRVLLMPSQFSTDHSVEDAVKMAKRLGVEYNVIPITDAYRAVVESMAPVIGGTKFDVTEENIQARIRCVMLMALANKYNCILLNTSNKSEAAVGYGTLYGDSAGSISVIGDLYKVEVYDLARYINRNMEVIPEHIIIKEPSAELRPDQKDSDSLPPYEVLDAILYRFIEEGQFVEDIVNAGYEYDVVDRVRRMIIRNEYKRFQSCPAINLSSCPFVTCFRLPLIDKYRY